MARESKRGNPNCRRVGKTNRRYTEDILNHCRGDGPHVKGCWVVDLVLGKE